MPDNKDEPNELFYQSSGRKQDASLHQGIIAPVDYPIDEKIMAPIRKKYRDREKARREGR